MIASIIAYGSSLFLLAIGVAAILYVASDKAPRGKDGSYLVIAVVFIFLAWLIAHFAGI